IAANLDGVGTLDPGNRVVDLVACVVLHGWQEVARTEVKEGAAGDGGRCRVCRARTQFVRAGEAEVVGEVRVDDPGVLRDAGVGPVLLGAAGAEGAEIEGRNRRAGCDRILRAGVAEVETKGEPAAARPGVVRASGYRDRIVRGLQGDFQAAQV